MSGIWDKYMTNAPVAVGETPADTIPEAKYPMKSIGANLRAVEGTSDKGVAYAFGDVSIQWQVLEGPLKGAATWIRHTISAPDKEGMDEVAYKRSLYFTQHFLDASGLGPKLDPTWAREEKPHPHKPGKTITVFRGRLLSRTDVYNIAKNEAEAAEFAKVLVGMNSIIKVGVKPYTRRDGGEGEENVLKGIEPLNDATLRVWRDGAAKQGSPQGASPSSSPYAT